MKRLALLAVVLLVCSAFALILLRRSVPRAEVLWERPHTGTVTLTSAHADGTLLYGGTAEVVLLSASGVVLRSFPVEDGLRPVQWGSGYALLGPDELRSYDASGRLQRTVPLPVVPAGLRQAAPFGEGLLLAATDQCVYATTAEGTLRWRLLTGGRPSLPLWDIAVKQST
jgi:hypothetical protein